MVLPTYTDAMQTTLAEEMGRSEQVYLIGEDGAMGSVFRMAA